MSDTTPRSEEPVEPADETREIPAVEPNDGTADEPIVVAHEVAAVADENGDVVAVEETIETVEPIVAEPAQDAATATAAYETAAAETGAAETGPAQTGPAETALPVAEAVAAPVIIDHAVAPAPAPAGPVAEAYPATPIYVQAPVAPVKKSNRGIGSLIALVGAVVYGVVYAGVAALIIGVGSTPEEFGEVFTQYLLSPAFYVPVIFYAIALIVLVLIANRANWWAYVLGGFPVAIVVYFAYIGGALLTVSAWELTPDEASSFIGTLYTNGLTLAAAIIAREVTIWIGAWLAARGHRLKVLNAAAQADYERTLAERPTVQQPYYAQS
ncbi:hypothetical protein [Compostimonas suwonensis]|uniref:Uncharacterized protein n=1 Tax=Compostimonas suwonensis TaxID=1048394 RepID=A0A2M9C5A8_9MICO|nr:hypothetical protein [Compostimonas suwonensis]PJJ65696.1 hypothetical protein CLV54_0733 [Compostimonas suwonensis]